MYREITVCPYVLRVPSQGKTNKSTAVLYLQPAVCVRRKHKNEKKTIYRCTSNTSRNSQLSGDRQYLETAFEDTLTRVHRPRLDQIDRVQLSHIVRTSHHVTDTQYTAVNIRRQQTDRQANK